MVDKPDAQRRQIVLSTLFASMVLPSIDATAAPPKAGFEYEIIGRPQPSPGGKLVELTHFFAYSCPYCYALEPFLLSWVKARSNFVTLKRQHIDIHNYVTHQKLYFALESMGEAEKYSMQVFEAYHKERNRLASEMDVLRLIEKLGINKSEFLGAYNSFSMQTKLARVRQLQAVYEANSVPAVVVDGRYFTSVEHAAVQASNASMEEKFVRFGNVLDFLVEKILKERGITYVIPA